VHKTHRHDLTLPLRARGENDTTSIEWAFDLITLGKGRTRGGTGFCPLALCDPLVNALPTRTIQEILQRSSTTQIGVSDAPLGHLRGTDHQAVEDRRATLDIASARQ
jgi:hypothetical protein